MSVAETWSTSQLYNLSHTIYNTTVPHEYRPPKYHSKNRKPRDKNRDAKGDSPRGSYSARGARADRGSRGERSHRDKPKSLGNELTRKDSIRAKLMKQLYWCPECNIPLLAKTCACKTESIKIDLQQPFDVRPALGVDRELINRLVRERFGDKVTLPKIIVLNKAGGMDRNDLVILNGVRFAWLNFDNTTRRFSFDIEAEALPWLIEKAERGIVRLEDASESIPDGRLGGKKVALKKNYISENKLEDGVVIVRYKSKYGTGILKGTSLKIKELASVEPAKQLANPDWMDAVQKNAFHLKNMERTAVREIRQNLSLRPTINCSFSGGKDSTAVWNIAKKAGVEKAFFIDTGLEFPETIEFVKSQDVEFIQKAGNFWQAVEKAGPPAKDHRWCCKLLKLNPLKVHLNETGECLTVQGNRWYESWNRAELEAVTQNPNNPLQLNISPIRSWRALDVFFYLWLREIPYNPLYEMGYERIGCYLCPAMLEAEHENMERTHPEMMKKWDDFLNRWAIARGLPPEFISWGLWRWKELPPKMRELVREYGLDLSEKPVKRSTPASIAHLMPEHQRGDLVDDSVEATLSVGVESVEEASAEDASVEEVSAVDVSVEDMSVMSLDEVESIESLEDVTANSVEDVEPIPTIPELDVEKIRLDFPMIADCIYLDNGATSFSPIQVIAAASEFDTSYRSNVGRGVHRLTKIATQKYWHAHEKVSAFINGQSGTTVFTKNSTEALNIVARGFPFKAGDTVVTTILEHHSNLLPWRALKKNGVNLKVIDINDDLTLDMDALEKTLEEDKSVRLVTVTHVSNVTGTINPVEKIGELCRKHGVKLCIDGAQAAPHMPVDVEKIGADFYIMSGHKMLGPTGTGVLWMRDDILEPLIIGGGMVESVSDDDFVPAKGYAKYEAGTPNISGGIGLGAAVDYLSDIGMDAIFAREQKLGQLLIDGLEKIEGVRVIVCKDAAHHAGAVSFTIEGAHPHEIAAWLDEEHAIEVRSGMHCAEPLMRRLGAANGTVRASLAFYNTESEVMTLVSVIRELC